MKEPCLPKEFAGKGPNWLSHSWGTGSGSRQGVWILSKAHFLISHCLASVKREQHFLCDQCYVNSIVHKARHFMKLINTFYTSCKLSLDIEIILITYDGFCFHLMNGEENLEEMANRLLRDSIWFNVFMLIKNCWAVQSLEHIMLRIKLSCM